ncbi:DUF222 domain-containing protein [Candidatus Poriferisocius sp.]|uniref:HNH endonuclease n=1 Tax=Candidatus Poriferisocius sp. TaxID=3101276 RepID=UPI003B016DF7
MEYSSGFGIYSGSDTVEYHSEDTPGQVGARCCKCLCCEQVDYSDLSSDELLKLVFRADHTRRQLEGLVTALLGRFGELEGDEAVREVCRQFGVGRYRANRQAKTVNILKDLPHTLDAVKDGWVSMDHAQLIGESHLRAPLAKQQEAELIALAIVEDLDKFKKTVGRCENERSGDDSAGRMEQQRRRRKAAVFNGDDDMVVLHAELDAVSGERVKTALDGMCDRMLRHDFQSGNDRTFQQRCADALVNLVTQTPGTGIPTGEDQSDPAPQATTLLVKVDYDALTGQLKDAALMDDTPIGIDELRHIACDAGIIPAIFNADGVPLYLGRKQRAASHTQKLALQARDKHCVGCRLRATACEAHHILWWEQGGTTNIDNLVLLCPSCHTKVHKHGHTLTTDPKGRHRVKPPSPFLTKR